MDMVDETSTGYCDRARSEMRAELYSAVVSELAAAAMINARGMSIWSPATHEHGRVRDLRKLEVAIERCGLTKKGL